MIRRHVEWLAASRESSVSFMPVNALDGIAAGASQFVPQCNPTPPAGEIAE